MERLLECSHEEADDRIMFHVNHAVKIGNFRSIAIASPDTDVLVAAIHHYNKFIYFDLEELWFISGKSESRTVLPIHDLVNEIDTDFIDILPAIHALTGCDTTSKVGTKKKAIKKGNKNAYNLLCYFGKNEISESMIADAEKFLVQCITSDDTDNFDDLRFNVYHKKHLQFDTERFPPTSASIRQHILHAYLQCYMWYHCPFTENIHLNPLEYGYKIDEEENLVPIIMTEPCIADDFPQQCHCVKCARQGVCPCRQKKIVCCRYCKCEGFQKVKIH